MENILVLYMYLIISLTLSITMFILYKCLTKCKSCKESKNIDKEGIRTVLIAGFTFLWYAISVTFTIFNKWFLNEWEGGFKFPIMCSCIHLIMKFGLTRIWVSFNHIPMEPISWSVVFRVVIPIGVATAMDIMCSNVSLMYISVTLYTVIKASVVVWVFFWGVLFRLEKFRVVTFLSVIITSAGLGLAVSSHTTISVAGLILCLVAAAAGGLRWALTQQLMVSDESSKNIFVAIYRFSPASALSMIPFAIALELRPVMMSSVFISKDPDILLQALGMTAAGGLIAFALILTEVNLVRLTSSLTMGMLGQMKEVLQIALALIIFRDELHLINGIGIFISLVASAFYRYIKAAEAKELALNSGYLQLSQVETELDVFDDTIVSAGGSADENLSDNNDEIDTPHVTITASHAQTWLKAGKHSSPRSTNGAFKSS